MARQINISDHTLDNLKKTASRAAMMVTLLAVAGCSTPDWVNPVNWFGDDEEDQAVAATEAAKEGEYPKLGAVPDQAGTTISIQEAGDIKEGLNADRSNAQYTDQQLRAETSSQPAPAPAPAPQQVAAAPSTPVKANQLPSPTQQQAAQQVVTPQGQKLMPSAAPVTTPQQAYARQVPGTGTTVIGGGSVQSVYQQQLAASAATTTNLPANTQFQTAPVTPLGNSAVSVSPIVRDVYNQPVAMGYGAATGAVAPQGYAGSTAGLKPAATIHFEVGSARVGAGDRKKLADVARLQKQTGATVKVVGHASSRTRQLPLDRHKMVNLRMSQERSSAVVKTLIQQGVPSQKIRVEAVSDSQPLAREAMPSDEAKNRRTEIFLVN